MHGRNRPRCQSAGVPRCTGSTIRHLESDCLTSKCEDSPRPRARAPDERVEFHVLRFADVALRHLGTMARCLSVLASNRFPRKDARMRLTRGTLLAVGLTLAFAAFPGAASRAARTELAAKLSDAEFWKIVEEFSEPNGYFRSDNLLSNELWFQTIV